MHISYVQTRFCYFKALNCVVCVLSLFSLVNEATSLKCYVCNTEENKTNCDKFRENENLYAKECPPNSLGCSTQNKGDTIINMACEDYKVNDCQTANEIEYCYCSTDLCNNESIKKSITITSSLGLDHDDEDLFEGSGYNKIHQISKPSDAKQNPTVQPPNTGDCLHGTLIIVVASLLLP